MKCKCTFYVNNSSLNVFQQIYFVHIVFLFLTFFRNNLTDIKNIAVHVNNNNSIVKKTWHILVNKIPSSSQPEKF